MVASAGGLVTFYGNDDGTVGAPQIESTPSSPTFFVTGDFNQDGYTDVAYEIPAAYVNAITPLQVSLGSSAGFSQGFQLSLPSRAQAIAAYDFNGDGHLDLAFSDAGGTSILLGDGKGGFVLGNAYPFVGTILPGDLNGDGKVDLLIAGGGEPEEVDFFSLIGDGKGAFGAPTAFTNEFSSTLTADVNGDNLTDLIYQNFNPDVLVVALGKGDGAFNVLPSTLSLPGGLFLSGDFNGDQKIDIVALKPGKSDGLGNPIGPGDQLFTSLGNGDGNVSPPNDCIL